MVSISEKVHRMDLVNPLVKKAFGQKYAGNFIDATSYDIRLIEGNVLEVIGCNGFFGAGVVGRFDSEDGASIIVLPKFVEQSKIYAKLYEREFGKSVTITTDSQADRLQRFV